MPNEYVRRAGGGGWRTKMKQHMEAMGGEVMRHEHKLAKVWEESGRSFKERERETGGLADRSING